MDVSANSLFEQNYTLICRELGGVPQGGLVSADRSKLPPVPPLPEQLWHGLNARNLPCLVIVDNFPEDVALRPTWQLRSNYRYRFARHESGIIQL